MPATPAWIAQFTVDGVALTRVDTALRGADPSAVDEGDREIEMFFDAEADAIALVDERWNWKKTRGRVHEAIEFETSFGLGTTNLVAPAVPNLTVVDEARGINATARIRAFVKDYTQDRYSLELLG